MKVTRKAAATALLTCAAVLLSACSAPEGQAPGSSSTFDSSTYPEEVFADLSSPLTWYDSSGGLPTEAKNETVWEDFAKLTGVPVREEFTDGTITKFRAAAQSGNVPWNLLEVGTGAEFMQVRDEGLLEPLDTSVVPVDLLESGSVDEYGIKAQENGAVLTWNTNLLKGEKPTSSADLFDLERFPGKRCLYKYSIAGGVLESALYADGVAKDKIYPLDVDRSLRKLQTIKANVIWWDSASTALQLLNNGECSMAMMWTGRVHDAIEKQGLPLDFTWDGGLLTSAYFAVPKGATDKKVGFAAIAMWIKDQAAQIDYVNRTTYTTPIPGIDPSDYDPTVQPYLAVTKNTTNAIVEDPKTIARQMDEMSKKMNAFLAG